jgi:ankyrin repeat protein
MKNGLPPDSQHYTGETQSRILPLKLWRIRASHLAFHQEEWIGIVKSTLPIHLIKYFIGKHMDNRAGFPFGNCHGALQPHFVSVQQTPEDRQLFLAVKSRLPEDATLRLLDKGASHIAIDENGKTILEVAVQAGYLALAQRLVSQGAPYNRLTQSRKCLVMLAAEHGHRELVEALITIHQALTPGDDAAKRKLGVVDNLAFVDPLKRNALMLAAMNGHADVVRYLLRLGADVNAVAPGASHGAMLFETHFAAAVTGRDATPLMFAVARNQLEIADLLIAQGAKADCGHSESALDLAAINGSPTMIRILLRAGANPKRIGYLRGPSPLIFAAQCNGGHTEAVRILAPVSDLDFIDFRNQGKTALGYAIQNRNIEVVKILLELGADPKVCPLDQPTNLMVAVSNSDYELVALLIAHGAWVDQANLVGESAWSVAFAATHPNAAMLDLLASAKSQNFLKSWGDGTIFLDIQLAHPRTVEELLQMGLMREIAATLVKEREKLATPNHAPQPESAVPAARQRLRLARLLLDSPDWRTPLYRHLGLPRAIGEQLQQHVRNQRQALQRLAQGQLEPVQAFMQDPISRLLALQPATDSLAPVDVFTLVLSLGQEPGLPSVAAKVLAKFWAGAVEAAASFGAGDFRGKSLQLLLSRTLAHLARVYPSLDLFNADVEHDDELDLLDLPLIDSMISSAPARLVSWQRLLANPAEFLCTLENRGTHLRDVQVPALVANLCMETGLPHAVALLLAQAWQKTVAKVRQEDTLANGFDPKGLRRRWAAGLALNLGQASAGSMAPAASPVLQATQEHLLTELCDWSRGRQDALPALAEVSPAAEAAGQKRAASTGPEDEPSAKRQKT